MWNLTKRMIPKWKIYYWRAKPGKRGEYSAMLRDRVGDATVEVLR